MAAADDAVKVGAFRTAKIYLYQWYIFAVETLTIKRFGTHNGKFEPSTYIGNIYLCLSIHFVEIYFQSST